MARSVRRVPSAMRTRVKPIPAWVMTSTSRAPCPLACRSSRSRRSSVACVVAGVLVGLVDVEQVDDAELAGHGWVLQSTTQATGHAVAHFSQVRAISVMPSPVSTSDSVMSSDPQSEQTWAWSRTRKPFTAAHPDRGVAAGEQQPVLSVAVAIADARGISVAELAGKTSHQIQLGGQWWSSSQTSRSGDEKIASQQVEIKQEGELLQIARPEAHAANLRRCMTARRLIVPDTRPAQPVALHRTWSGQLR
jgi:hypothetical protein